MKKRNPVFWLSFFLLTVFLALPTAFAHANKPLIMDLGSIAPAQKMSRALAFTLPVPPTQAVQFKGTGLSAAKTGNRIPAERLTFTPDPSTQNNATRTVYHLQIQLLPSEPPGEYEGLIYAVYPTAKRHNPAPYWSKSRSYPGSASNRGNSTPQLNIAASPFLREDKLLTRNPVKLLLASNAPWRLLLRLENETPFHTSPFPLQIGIGKTLNTVVFKERMRVSDDYRPVAFGAPTVVGDGSTPANYWTELYLTAAIDDWYHYPTGNYNFKMFLAAETLLP